MSFTREQLDSILRAVGKIYAGPLDEIINVDETTPVWAKAREELGTLLDEVTTPRIIAVVNGGVLDEIFSDRPVLYLTKDWDNIKESPSEAAAFINNVKDIEPHGWNDAIDLESLEALQAEAVDGVDTYTREPEAG